MASADRADAESISWKPDRRTILWASSVLHEDRISESLRQEVEDRRGDLNVGSAEYWRLVTSVAVEHVTFDLVEQAKRWGTDFSSVDWDITP